MRRLMRWCRGMVMDDELARALGEISSQFKSLANEVQSNHRQLSDQIGHIKARMDELSGSVALVLVRSAENKKKPEDWQTLMQVFTGD